jgi:hypothetical protein
MSLVENILVHGIITFILLLVYLLPVMRFLNPRIWAFSDYPKAITSIVEPQTKREQQIGTLLFLPFLILMIGIPLISTLILESTYVVQIPFLDAFLNAFAVLMFGNAADLFILDLLIVGTITPTWVIIPGTEHLKDTEYKAFRKEHAIGHVYGTIAMAILSAILALVVVIF